MDPIQAAENKDMPTKSQPTIDLTEQQRDALFGGSCTPGDTYTIKLKAGDLQDAGMQTFDILDKSEDSEAPGVEDPDEEAREDAAGVSQPADDEEDPSETSMLGYNRKKVIAGRRKIAPKMSPRDLEYD